VADVRGKEMSVLRKTAFLHAGTSFVWVCAPFVVSLVTFATYVLLDESNVLDAEKVRIICFNF
jgi:ATP-binding cassette subfamily C (CFTR/MRP) protein 1